MNRENPYGGGGQAEINAQVAVSMGVSYMLDVLPRALGMTSELLPGSVNTYTCSHYEQRHSALVLRGGIGSVECIKINRDKESVLYCVSVNWY